MQANVPSLRKPASNLHVRPATGRVGPTPGIFHPSNELNSLSGKDWIKLTKSFWFQTGLGKGHSDTQIEREHPAPFSYKDIQKLIAMFTQPGMVTLDPFCGVASTLKAAALSNRNAIGIEISSRWVKLGKKRLRTELPKEARKNLTLKIIKGDCLKRLPKLHAESIDFIVTSPPYWNILGKAPDLKITSERIRNGLATRYSSSPRDLGNISDYDAFLKKLGQVAVECNRVLRRGKYLALIVGDFRHGRKYHPYHIDVERVFETSGFCLQGITILAQNNKRLFPYGYPFSFVQNIHHQYILIFQKPKLTNA